MANFDDKVMKNSSNIDKSINQFVNFGDELAFVSIFGLGRRGTPPPRGAEMIFEKLEKNC